ncbi:MAG: DNA-directed RNA polymerase subunit beta [Candidatus Vogelbacteria bacterium]|nr:DNA-directed RNA polymerase subunit beta [Candidatus Vogelbacteria bacterium]
MRQKHFSRYRAPLSHFPDLVSTQKESYKWLVETGLKELFKEFSPIKDYSEKKFELEFLSFQVDEPKFDEYYAKQNRLSYDAPLRVRVKLKNKIVGTEKEQEIFLADFPIMTSHGTFIINGNERVVVSQLARSFGIFFTENELRGKKYFGAKIIPGVGAWIEFETEPDDTIYVRIDRKRKFPFISLLRVLADLSGKSVTDEEILAAFTGLPSDTDYAKIALAKDHAKTTDDSYLEIFKRLRDSDLATAASAKEYLTELFSRQRYDLSTVGRVRFNRRFNKSLTTEEKARRSLNFDDIVAIVRHIITLNNTKDATADDIDHLGLRRIRCAGEMFQQKLRVGMVQMRRNIQDRMSTIDSATTMPIQFISPRPLQARLKEFFTTNQLSQFMDQKNILGEVEHLRRLSAMGPGGLTRKRSGLEVRDVHTSHYSRVCPIHTPEGPNIGLILQLANYARINEFGVIEAPYRRVKDGKITDELVHLNALEEENHIIAHGAWPYDQEKRLIGKNVEVRIEGRPGLAPRDQVDFIDVAPYQAYSVATAMIPFLEHDDANRALMGSNMQKQAVPCVVPEVPLVATGLEKHVAYDSGRLILSKTAGTVTAADGRRIRIKPETGTEEEYPLVNFMKTNSNTTFHQRPIVSVGQAVKKGEILADTSSSVAGQASLGQNVLVAFMSLDGANYEDAIVISERLVRNSKFTSIHIEEFPVPVRDTKLGPEITTHDIPNVGEAKLKNLDEDGIIRIGAEVEQGDILVGKITPKGETELTPEERLLRSIFGEKARDVKDSSLRMPNGKKGKVVGVKVFSREHGDKLESGITKRIHVEVAELRNISVGDKLAGRHGNKGVISRVLPMEDMPYTADGTPIDVVLTPLGVPSRMNLGQILEMHLGLAAHTLGYQAITPPFMGVTEQEIKEELKQAGFSESGKVTLYDGHTGEPYADDIAIGYMYVLKLDHMVEDKIHMRSIGPYSLITQQPLGGKAQRGGQRFGEMEVWALEGYGAAYSLREMLTIKSDDIMGRSQAFDAIVKGETIPEPNLPASFNVMLNELRGLALDVELKKV